MAKRDVLDKTLAQRFAWRLGSAADLLEKAEENPLRAGAPEGRPKAPPKEEASTPEQDEAERAARERERDDLAKQTARVWQMTSESLQAEATLGLLRRVQALGLELAGMVHHPRENVLLWRLFVRHYDRLRLRDRRDGTHAMSFMPVDPEHREAAELLIEVAEKGDSWLAFMMETGEVATEALGRKHPDLGPRLARILDEGKSWASREIAARWLAIAEPRHAIPPLRRALLLPHVAIRWIALEILLEMSPPAVTEADVLWLLADALKHPVPESLGKSSGELASGYAEALILAVAKVRPPEGYRALEIIDSGGGVAVRGTGRWGRDDGWALRALAVAYPERALARIDRRLAQSRLWRRHDGVRAAALLPEDLARPRLLDAAAQAEYHAAERAKELWFERFGEACPTTPLAGVAAQLLSAPPSERFLSCLTVLRGASREAKAAMVKALLAEGDPERSATPTDLTAGERETLVLLLFSLDDFASGPGLPPSEREWTALLLKRFGDEAFEGLSKLAAPAARAGVDLGWLSALAGAAQQNLLSASQRDRLREIGRDALCSPAWDGATAPLVALSYVGAPLDLADRLWAIAMGDTPGLTESRMERAHALYWASDVLVGMKDFPALDARIAEEGEAALRSRSWERLSRIMSIGCRRRLASSLDLAARCIEALDEDPAAFDASNHCIYALEEAGRIDDGWLLDLLSRPESPRFGVAAGPARTSPSPAVVSALESALGSSVRGGAAAAEAAEALVARDALGLEDARLEGILAGAPAYPRALLVVALIRLGAPLPGLRRHALELLVSVDEKASMAVLDALLMKEPDGTNELFESVLELSPAAEIRRVLELVLKRPSEAELYFQDADEDDEDDEDDDEDDDGEDDGGDGAKNVSDTGLN